MKSRLSLSEKGATGPGESRISLEGLFKSFQRKKSNIPVAMKQVNRQSKRELLHLLIDRFFHLDDGPQKQTAEQLMDVMQVALKCGDVEAVELSFLSPLQLCLVKRFKEDLLHFIISGSPASEASHDILLFKVYKLKCY